MDWKKQASIERRSQASTVLMLETEDPKRVGELLTFIASPEFTSKEYFNMEKPPVRMLIDPWEGTSSFKLEDGVVKEESVKSEESDSPFAGLSGLDFSTAIRKVDDLLKTQSTVVVIRGITRPELAASLALPIQNWRDHPGLLSPKHKSTVFVVTPDIFLFDEWTRRHAVIIEPPFSTEDERRVMLKEIALNFNKTLDDLMVRASAGMTLHDLETSALRSIYETQGNLEVSYVTRTKMDLMKKSGFELQYPKFGFEMIGGYNFLKAFFKKYVIDIIRNPKATEWGVRISRGILLFGPGGTGKSLFAKAIAKVLQLPFIKVDSSKIFAGIVGESEKNIRRLRKVAEANSDVNAPAIVFFDEVDQLIPSREGIVSTDSGVSRRAVNMLMDWWGDDERKCFLMAATNLIQQCDSSAIRAGRIDDKVPQLYPDYYARIEIFKVHTGIARKLPLDLPTLPEGAKRVDPAFKRVPDFRPLAEMTEDWSGAEIEALCVKAGVEALSRNAKAVTNDDFATAIKFVEVNKAKRREYVKTFLAIAREYASSPLLLEAQIAEMTNGKGKASRYEAMLEELKTGELKTL